MAIKSFNRYEKKYLLNKEQYNNLIPRFLEYMNPDEHCKSGKNYSIYNIYYDTDNNDVIRHSICNPYYKEKLRLRSYTIPNSPNSKVFLELKKKINGYSSNFPITLIMLPVIIAIIILLVGNNIATAFSLAGVFSIIRFRSAPGDAKDIAYVFFTLAVGLTCGIGYIIYAVIFTIILCTLMILLDVTKFGKAKQCSLKLQSLKT